MRSKVLPSSCLPDIQSSTQTFGTVLAVEEDEDAAGVAYEERDPRWVLAQKIVASKSFGKSLLLSKFLLYVCHRALSGRTDEISEQQIGVQVFGRKPQYNSAEDNIVRNYARQLRQRLDAYFEDEGRLEELRLSIPRGTYVPTFTRRETATAGPLLQEMPPVPIARDSWRLRGYALCGLLLAAVVGALLWMAIPRVIHAESDPSHALWSQLFNSRQTFLVPADDGIVMFQNLTGHSVHLAEYVSRSYLSVTTPYHIDQQNMEDLDAQRYTSVADLDAVLKFTRLSEEKPEHVMVRYARELHMDDLKDANAILLGSSYSNPWVELFQKSLNFEFSYAPHPNESYITNKHPLTGEAAMYRNDADTPVAQNVCSRGIGSKPEQYGLGSDRRGSDHGRDAGSSGDAVRPQRDASGAAEGEDFERNTAAVRDADRDSELRVECTAGECDRQPALLADGRCSFQASCGTDAALRADKRSSCGEFDRRVICIVFNGERCFSAIQGESGESSIYALGGCELWNMDGVGELE